MCTHLLIFFFLRDNQFTSVGLHSTIVLKTQVHSNTPCWGLKNLKKKTKKKTWKLSQRRDKSTEQIFFLFQLNLMKKPEYLFEQTQF